MYNISYPFDIHTISYPLIDIFLVGKNLDFNYTSQLENKIEKLINRKVSFFLTSKSPEIKPKLTLFSQ